MVLTWAGAPQLRRSPWAGWLRRRSLGAVPARVEGADVVVAAAFCALDLLVFWTWWKLPPHRTVTTWAPVGASVVTFACLVLRRRRPVTVLGVVCVLMVAESRLPGYEPLLAVLVALPSVALRRGPRASVLALLASALATGAVVLDTVGSSSVRPWAAVSVWVLIDGAVWAVARRLRAYALQTADLEARRRAAAAEAVAAERLRIARELHDILAHSVSVMVLQAAGARAVLGSDAERAGQALDAVRAIGQQAMEELRRLLTVLRADGAAAGAGQGRQPPGLADVDDLVAVARGAGARISVERRGAGVPLDPSVELAAYRLIQEALTNARKYAGARAEVLVRLCWHDRGLDVVIEDSTAGPAIGDGAPELARDAVSTGHGLLGLRERISAVGGTFSAGPLPAGFRVAASLPRSVSDHAGAVR